MSVSKTGCSSYEQYTWAELRAARLLIEAGEIPLDNRPVDYHEAGNRIIELAERIKAERSVVAMQ